MLVDMHAHTKGISWCCQAPAEKIVADAKAVGLDGIILTNHYQELYVTDKGIDEFVERYIAEYHYTKECGEKIGIKVFFGLEVTMNENHRNHMLVYGITEDYLRAHPALFTLSLEELYETVHAGGGVLVQGHPYRDGAVPLDSNYLDGIEINCHPLYQNAHSADLEEIAKRDKLMLTCGGDYHADAYRAHCGAYLPDSVKDIHDIAEFVRSSDRITLRIHDVGAPDWYDKEFVVR